MKKPKRKTKWITLNKEFSTFKAFKTFAWFNMKPGECTKGFEIFEDTVIKEYNLNRKEKRLIIEKIYDEQKEALKHALNQQLKLW